MQNGQPRICGAPRAAEGFTLLELMVVIALIATLVGVAIPRIGASLVSDPTSKVSRWLINNINALKNEAVRKQKAYTLHIDLDRQRLWMTHEGMAPETEAAAEEKEAFQLPESVQFHSLLLPGQDPIQSGTAALNFSPKGYSDRALIRLTNDDDDRYTFWVEPFLARVARLDGFEEF
ncbi:MAG: prepilin-type N-terminal cleavage/methylation domain-containing protein [Desulfosarcinaceae bacterium]|nr:prepilin-type N-terminal cleavage/methylation domain-containing protein [Desulfosarcinaceae bacterium]